MMSCARLIKSTPHKAAVIPGQPAEQSPSAGVLLQSPGDTTQQSFLRHGFPESNKPSLVYVTMIHHAY